MTECSYKMCVLVGKRSHVAPRKPRSTLALCNSAFTEMDKMGSLRSIKIGRRSDARQPQLPVRPCGRGDRAHTRRSPRLSSQRLAEPRPQITQRRGVVQGSHHGQREWIQWCDGFVVRTEWCSLESTGRSGLSPRGALTLEVTG